MIARFLAAAAFALIFVGVPVRAQEQSFAAFVTELWPDAQAKGVTRATFDLAMRGVTPDQRVIAATKRQPEYGKPVGDYINSTRLVGPHRARPGQGEGMVEDLRRGRKEIRRRALGAGGAVGHGNRLRRGEGQLGRVPLAGDARLT